ncbi:MAG: hypothetical protein ACTSWY_02970 [Promethearchaeota archaeon]
MVFDLIDVGIFSSVIFLLVVIIIFIIKHYRKKVRGYRAKYPSNYECIDGHRVRSLSELIIDNCLFRNGISHKNEDIILNNSGKKYKFDWFLPDIDVYLEFFGFSGKKYHETRIEKEKFYRKNHLKMIAIEPFDLINIEDGLKHKLGKSWKTIVKNGISRFCPQCGEKLDKRVLL